MTENRRWITVVTEKFWSDEKVAELRRLWVEENLSGSQIAEILGLKDRNAVMGKLHRLGLKRSDMQDAAAVKLDTKSSVSPEPRSKADAGKTPAAVEPPSPAPVVAEAVAAEVVAAVPPEPQSPAEPEQEGPVGHPVMRLKERSCRWPHGDPRDTSTFSFCCKPRLGSLPYCTEHAEKAYHAPEARNSRRRDVAPARLPRAA